MSVNSAPPVVDTESDCPQTSAEKNAMTFRLTTNLATAVILTSFLFCGDALGQIGDKSPNVLFIAVDDLTDWMTLPQYFRQHGRAI